MLEVPTLKKLVADILRAKDPDTASLFDDAFKDRAGADMASQMAELNKFWRLQLGVQNSDTTAARECLLDNIELSEWLGLFTTHVAPAIVAYRLPNLLQANRPACWDAIAEKPPLFPPK